MSGLAIVKQVEKACALLAEAKTLDEVLHVHDKARALETYAGLRAKGSEAHADAWELCKLAERRLGELLAALPKAAPGRKKSITPVIDSGPKPKREVLRELSIAPEQGRRYERTAAEPLPAFNEYLATGAAALAKGKAPPSFSAVSSGAGYDGDEYGTPSKYLEAAREVMGPIELDPASNATAASIVAAERWHHKGDSILDQPWVARSLWLNPPYSAGLIDRFVDKLVASCCVDAGVPRVEKAIALVNSAPSAKWFQKLLAACEGFVLFDHRVAFLLDGKPIKGNRYEQAAFYFGDDSEPFLDAFSRFGTPCRTAFTGPATEAG